nr:hypothetical protein [Tanacetum cinerariifolium]
MLSDSHATVTYTSMSSYEVTINGYYGMPMDPLDPYVQLVMGAPPSPNYIPGPEAPWPMLNVRLTTKESLRTLLGTTRINNHIRDKTQARLILQEMVTRDFTQDLGLYVPSAIKIMKVGFYNLWLDGQPSCSYYT